MKNSNKEVYVLGSSRVPFVKSMTDYMNVTRKELLVGSLNGLINKYKLENKLIDDVAIGAVLNSSSDFNMSREAILSTKLDPNTPAYNVQRACGTALETTWEIALKAHVGAINLGIAGGVDTNSDIPIEVSDKLRKALVEVTRAKSALDKIKLFADVGLTGLLPKTPVIDEPRTKLSMGGHTELMVKEWKISREEQDEFAYLSHKNAGRAYSEGFFDDLVVPFNGVKKDKILREDTTVEKLAKLKPAFDKVNGSLTAGNSSALTDGSAVVLVANDIGASQLGLKPMAKIIDVQVAAVDFVHGAGLLMAPTKAVAQLLTRNGLTFDDFDYFEIHEAFAGQVLSNLKAWETESYCRDVLKLSSALGSIDRKKININGSSLALGHPFAATGARIIGSLSKQLTTGKKRGLISICTAGGMGIAGILESV